MSRSSSIDCSRNDGRLIPPRVAQATRLSRAATRRSERGGAPELFRTADSGQALFRSVGPVAQRDGQVARATLSRGTGDPPVPSGDPPLGTERRVELSNACFCAKFLPFRRASGPTGRAGARATLSRGSTGDSPVPSGDPPLGTERRARTSSNGCFWAKLCSVPSGQWPNGTGRLPVLPKSISVRVNRPVAQRCATGRTFGPRVVSTRSAPPDLKLPEIFVPLRSVHALPLDLDRELSQLAARRMELGRWRFGAPFNAGALRIGTIRGPRRPAPPSRSKTAVAPVNMRYLPGRMSKILVFVLAVYATVSAAADFPPPVARFRPHEFPISFRPNPAGSPPPLSHLRPPPTRSDRHRAKWRAHSAWHHRQQRANFLGRNSPANCSAPANPWM